MLLGITHMIDMMIVLRVKFPLKKEVKICTCIRFTFADFPKTMCFY